MYLGKKVSIVFPVYNEHENIRAAIEEFLRHPAVDEVIAVDNNSTDGSAAEIKLTSAKYVKEMTRGYGAALQRGMREATGDCIVTCEPDGTFRADDLDRLLVYSQDYEVVIGTRTSRNPIWSGGDPGANMYFALRMGNWAVAKLLEYLFNGPSFTDIGCSYKLIHRHAYEKIRDSFTVTGNWFSPEYMIRVLQQRCSIVEIPVQYSARIGTSKITGKVSRAVALGLRMIWFILTERIKSWEFLKHNLPATVLIGIILILTAIPVLDTYLVLGDTWQGIPPTFTDETFYHARVQTIVKGYVTEGNPYFFEHRNDPPLVIFAGTWINALPQLAGLSLNTALLANFILWSVLFAVSLYWLFRELRAPPWLAVCGTVLLYLQSYAHVWRPANLQTVYPFYFLFYVALARLIREQSRRNIIFLAIVTGATFYLFAYLWQAVGITLSILLLYALGKKNWPLLKATLLSALIGGAIGLPVPLYALWLSRTSPYFWESVYRLGLVNTRLPMAEVVYSGGWIGIVLALLALVYWRARSLRNDEGFIALGVFIGISGLGLWIMQGSNLITGKLLETGEHVKLLILPWLIFSIISLGVFLWERRVQLSRGLRIFSGSMVIVLSVASVWYTYDRFSPFLPSHIDRVAWQTQQLSAKPFAWLQAEEKDPVVVWGNLHNPVMTDLPIFTRHFPLYVWGGMMELVPEGEVRERYLVSEYFSNPTSADLKSENNMKFYLGRHDMPHQAKTIERGIKLCRIVFFWDKNKECGTPPTPQSLLGDAFFNDLAARFQDDIKPHIREYLAKYHVSYILKDKLLDPQLHPEKLGAVRVYADDRYEIYHL